MNLIGSKDESLEITKAIFTEVKVTSTEITSDTNKHKGGKPLWVFKENHFVKDDKQK
ncbi:16772_t:CDS:2 [Dentiscutata heterogama]|uniref:16772_t:CDS:1 n=1 Tax=Dentiscutata heterogama TaxID=1316150 RepID=A0ACA9LTM0_9GLOM|nr:16772_t:CDS:2 [Dentiscutata heterogama]